MTQASARKAASRRRFGPAAGLGATAHLGALAGAQAAVQHEGQHGGQQQHQADGRALGEFCWPTTAL